jgi:hypothetical protein
MDFAVRAVDLGQCVNGILSLERYYADTTDANGNDDDDDDDKNHDYDDNDHD